MISMPGHRILVIDDESTHRILAREYLEAAGYIVRLAEDGARGLSMAKRNCPDLVLVDLMIPGIDGLEICRTLKANPGTAQVPIILITASREPDVIARGLEAGADDFVTKPVDWQFIHDRVAYVLAKAKERRRLLSEARAKATRKRLLGADAASAAAAPASPLQHMAATASTDAPASADSEAPRQSVELQYQAQIQELRDQLARTETAMAERLEEMRSAHAAELADLAGRTSESDDTQQDSEIARLNDQLEDLKRSSAAELEAAVRQAEENATALAERYERQIDALRTEAADSISTLSFRYEEERRGLLADLESSERSLEEVKHELQFAHVLSTTAANADESLSRVSACWDFVAACTSVYSGQVRALSESLQPARDALSSVEDPAAADAISDADLWIDALAGGLNTMRMLAQIMSGKSVLQEDEVDLGSLLEQVMSRMAPFAEQSRVNLHCDMPQTPVRVVADEARLSFAMLSVLMNAIRFSPHGASVVAALEDLSDGSVSLTIVDEGVGIDPARLAQLQTCLDRASWRVDEHHVGLGIPLAMAIARAHSGELEVDSALGGGTRVRLRLPYERVCAEDEDRSCALSA